MKLVLISISFATTFGFKPIKTGMKMSVRVLVCLDFHFALLYAEYSMSFKLFYFYPLICLASFLPPHHSVSRNASIHSPFRICHELGLPEIARAISFSIKALSSPPWLQS